MRAVWQRRGLAAAGQRLTLCWYHRERSLAGIRRKWQQDGDSDAEDPGAPEHQDAAEQSEESDAEYYRQEVGEEPDKGESGEAGTEPFRPLLPVVADDAKTLSSP